MGRLHSLTSLLSDPTPAHLAELVALAVVLVALIWLFSRMSPTTLVATGTGAEIFSGNWKEMHIPIPLDRALLGVGVVSMLLGGGRLLAARRLVLRPVHLLLLAVAAWATCSAIWAGTLTSHSGFYALLDRLGFIPFLAFVLAPLLFGSEAKRRVLLGALVIVGAYLGLIAVMEGVGLERFVEPSYIRNPSIGILFGRARGPFVEAAADGISLFICAVAAAIGLATWSRARTRLCCAVVMAACMAGTIFTLTRAVWIGAGLGAIVGLVAAPGTRRRAIPILVAVAGAVAVAIVAIPGLRSKVTTRASAKGSVWDRYNTNDAALRAIHQHPLFGIGWQRFPVDGPNYLVQAATYPLTGAGLEVHNVFLSHAVELGIPGSILWTAALLAAVGGAICRRGAPELQPWRAGLLGILVCYVVVANLGPLSYAFPNLVLWLLAGVVSVDFLSVPSRPTGRNLVVSTPETSLQRRDLAATG